MSKILADVEFTPADLAAQFWAMDSDEQADFFAALERIAGIKLCFQMAYVVDEIAKRSAAGERDAMNGFQTMLAHAAGFSESATDLRVWDAKRAISNIIEGRQQ